MKNLIKVSVVVVFLLTTICNAQSWGKRIKGNGKTITEKRTTAPYNDIRVAGFMNVILVSGTEGSITIEGEENLLPFIKIEVEGTSLKIYTEKNKQISSTNGKEIVITVPVETINQISLSGSGDIKSKDKIKSTSFVAQLSGSGNLTLDVDAGQFELSLSGSGNTSLSGNADSFESKLAGSGNISAGQFTAKNVDISISGSGNSTIFCSESLKARISGSGNIKYKGDPKLKDSKVSGSGEISKV